MRIEHGINPNCSELVIRLPDRSMLSIKNSLDLAGIKEEVVRDFWAMGIEQPEWENDKPRDDGNDCSQLVDHDLLPDMQNHADIRLEKHFDGEGIAIVGHQHCQKQLFPILKKISDLFSEPVESYDGGSTQYYDKWLEAGCPDIRIWEPDEEE